MTEEEIDTTQIKESEKQKETAEERKEPELEVVAEDATDTVNDKESVPS